MKIFKSLLVLIILFTQGIITPEILQFSATQLQSINVPVGTKTKIAQGYHKKVDDVGNTYYYVNNQDIGNPISNGYGNFKTYYKNGKEWSYTVDGKTRKGTMYFITLNEKFNDVAKGSVIFCVQPLQESEWIDDTKPNNSYYNKLSTKVQIKINKIVALATDYFVKTGNFDYLLAGQMLVWEAVGTKFNSYDNSVKFEKDKLTKAVNDYEIIPSFANQSIELQYNKQNQRYEKTIYDTNKVLDEKYLTSLVGIYNQIHIENGHGANDLKIWSKQELTNEVLINGLYNPMPSKPGSKLGIYYNTEPKFVNSGQDLVSGLSYDKIFDFSIKINPAQGKVNLKKCGETLTGSCLPLANVVFGLYDSEDNLLRQKKTNDQGLLSFTNIPLGKYYIKEIKTSKQYEINEQKYFFTITEDNQEINLNHNNYLENKLIKGKVKLTKVGEVNNNDTTLYPLAGVEFTIYQDSNKNGTLEAKEKDQVVQKLYTNKNGEIISDYLAYGAYIIKETTPLVGYINNGYEESFKIKQNGEIIELYSGADLENKLIKGQVDLYKTSDINYQQCRSLQTECLTNDNLLSGVRFAIYEDLNQNQKIDTNDRQVQTLTTNAQGYARSGYLKYGSYLVQEIQTIEGYEMNQELYPFTITKNNELIHLNQGNPIINSAKSYQLKIIKEDEQGNKIPGVTFGIYQDQNNNNKLDEVEENRLVDKIITNEVGEAQTTNLNYGSYIIKELAAPNKYLVSDKEYPIIINDDTQQEVKIKIVNKIKHGQIKIIKKDQDNKLLSGATFELYQDQNMNQKLDNTDRKITQIITNNLGEASFDNLEYGNYLIKESQAPKGYMLDNKIYPIKIKENNQIYELKVYNQKIADKLIITAKSIWKYLILIVGILGVIIFLIYRKISKRKNYI